MLKLHPVPALIPAGFIVVATRRILDLELNAMRIIILALLRK